MIKLGVVVILLSVVVFVAAMVAPQVIAPLGAIYCPTGQTMTAVTDTYSYRPGETDTNNYFYCVNSDGVQQSEVTGPVTLTLVALFVVPLLLGIGLTIIGGRRRAVQTAAGWRQSIGGAAGSTGFVYGGNPAANNPNVSYNTAVGTNISEIMDGLQRGVVRFGGQEVPIADLKSGAYQHQVTTDSKRTLADTLKQLTDAHTQGLINDDEYGRLRQDALDKLV